MPAQTPPVSTRIAGRQRVLTGIKPTGDLHLGNYFGAIRPCVEFSQKPEYEVILFCADWHGLTDRNRIFEPGSTSLPVIAAFLAFGFRAESNSLFLQSDFPEIQENAWYLSTATAVGLLERAHAYKDALASGKIATAALFNYPVLMSSDILTFDTEFVPVGKDQAQHIEYASDMGKLFNNLVGAEVFLEPKPLVQDVPLLPGIDGERKMSKSYDNTIPMFGAKKDIEKRIKAIKTDSLGLDDPKDPDTCLVYQILKSFGSAEAIAEMARKLRRGTGYGYGHAKLDLIAEHERVFGARRELFDHYVNSPAEVWKVMEPGFARAKSYAAATRARARAALKLVRLRPE